LSPPDLGTAMITDMHSHYYGQGLMAYLATRTNRPRLATEEGGRQWLHTPTTELPFETHHMDMAARAVFLDKLGLERQMLTFPGALGADALPLVDSGPLVQAYNDELAGVIAGSGGRYVGLAGLPLANMSEAAAELRRARRELGMLGAILPANYLLSGPEAEALTPVLQAANEDGGHIMIHPGLRADQELSVPKFADFHQHRASTIALQTALSHVMVTLMFGDLTERYPNVSFQVINLGGTLPYVLERLDEVSRLRTPDDPLPSSQARRVYVDSASLGPRALELAVKTYGADRIMLGSDFPIFTGDAPRRAVSEAAISEDDKQQILSGTADAVIDRLT